MHKRKGDMMYRTIKAFKDLQDGGYRYAIGDTFPRDGKEVTEARLHELASRANKAGEPLITEVKALEAEVREERATAEVEAEAETEQQKKSTKRTTRKRKVEE